MSKWMDWKFLAVWGLGVEIYHHRNVYMYAQGGMCVCVSTGTFKFLLEIYRFKFLIKILPCCNFMTFFSFFIFPHMAMAGNSFISGLKGATAIEVFLT